MNNTYKIGNENFNIPEKRYKYNEIRRLYEDYSNYLVEEFEEVYKFENRNFKDVYNKISKQGEDRIIQIAKITSDYLREEKIINIDGEELFRNYKKTDRYNPWRDQVKEIRMKYLELEYGREYVEKLYGEVEVDLSSQKILKEAAHKVENILDKSISYFEKQSLHKDKRILKKLKTSLYETCFAMHYDYINIIEKNKGEKLYSYVTKEDEKEAEDLFEKILKTSIKRDAKLEFFFRILNKNPYKEKYYKYIFMEYGDENGELERLAMDFGLDINSYKVQSVLEHYNRYEIKTKSLVTLRQELINLIRLYLIKINLINHSNSIKLKTNNLIIEEIDKKIVKARNRFNKIDGIEYKSFGTVVSVKIEIELIEKKLKEIDFNSITELKKLVLFLKKEIESNVKYDYLEGINKRIKDLRDKEIESLIEHHKKETIKDIDKLIQYITERYSKEESEKYIKKLNNKISYIKTKEKISDTYEDVKDKSKEFIKKFFD